MLRLNPRSPKYSKKKTAAQVATSQPGRLEVNFLHHKKGTLIAQWIEQLIICEAFHMHFFFLREIAY